MTLALREAERGTAPAWELRFGARVRFDEEQRRLTVERGDETGARALLLCNLAPEPQPVPSAKGFWRRALWSGDARYDGDTSQTAPPERLDGEQTVELAGWSAALYVSETSSSSEFQI